MRRFALLPTRTFDPSGLLGAAIVLGAVATAEILVRLDELVDRLGNGVDEPVDGEDSAP